MNIPADNKLPVFGQRFQARYSGPRKCGDLSPVYTTLNLSPRLNGVPVLISPVLGFCIGSLNTNEIGYAF